MSLGDPLRKRKAQGELIGLGEGKRGIEYNQTVPNTYINVTVKLVALYKVLVIITVNKFFHF